MNARKKKLPENSTQTDQELWHEVQFNNCALSFSTLFDRYWSTLYTSAFFYIEDKEKSEEITHDILLNLWQKREKLHIQSFSAYLRAAARYHVYKVLKAQKSSVITYTADWEQITVPLVLNEGENNIRHEETSKYILGIVQNLPARCREIFLLSRMDNMTNEEIAVKLGISKRTVENQITTALHYIRRQLHVLATIIILLLNYY
ncbi:RNA polymerase sigma-70 factor [Sphingobacterium pedocola]|uniref:RNA polymerase sigma-70 factor n=1 Tax=Sphingobacterium pedocola TaxID=2082722 RepID=A0ABR9T602_9SPHI|nr:RNA polymerase sigma-70 factor [Sphingobacterium pedocola]MBE8720768.1 RNA polymerase sigma-70 factor [Sphingobacterium pedocola]